MGETYLFIKYLLKEKKFVPVVTGNYIDNNVDNFNNYEIKYISDNYIILNNLEKKEIYFIEINSFYMLNKTYNYYLNVVGNDNYLLYDNIKKNDIEFTLINLSDLTNEDNNNALLNLITFKIDINLPKIIMNDNLKTFIFLFQNNQLCFTHYIYNDSNKIEDKEKEKNEKKSNEIETNEIKDNEIETNEIKDNEIKDNEIKDNEISSNEIKDNEISSNEIKDNEKEKIKDIIIKKADIIIPKIDSFSEVYSRKYEPSKLFIEKDYYCSKTPLNNFIIFDFLNEYFFNGFRLIFLSSNENCRPKNIIVSILDDKKDVIKDFKFINDNIRFLSRDYIINYKCRYLKFDFKDNFGGDYIIINNIMFYASPIDSVEFK